MNLVKWRPMRELDEIKREMDNLFTGFLGGPRRFRHMLPGFGESGILSPDVEMYDHGTELTVKAELPGVEKKDIDISISHGTLTIQGELKKEEEVKEDDYYYSERSFGHFERSLVLPTEVKEDEIKASFKNGVLEITLPKKEGEEHKEIKVGVN